jgi:ABC-2 type transport system ATP-binding protein
MSILTLQFFIMLPGTTSEISSYLQHQDYSLAIRRLLDISLDTSNPELIRNAIDISKRYHEMLKQNNVVKAKDDLVASANEVLQQIQLEKPKATSVELLVSASNVSKTYFSGHFTLHPVSLKVSTGDIIGVVGENGNGKTTLLRCLAGQLAIDKGNILHTQVKEPGYFAIKNTVAFIPQRIPKWYGLLKDNLYFSVAITGVTGEKNDLMVDFMLERLSLSSYSHLTWNQISSGYRTRFEIARVLLQKPSLLILDEPLANLDIKAQQTILTDLKFMAKSTNHPMGVVLSSQQLHEVEKIADNVVFIKQGNCLFQTTENNETTPGYVLELETQVSRHDILRILGEGEVSIQFNGGFYTVTSATCTVQEMLNKLVSNQVSITYFRDITYSTKRFFN